MSSVVLLYLVSDSSGDTVTSIARSVCAQFSDIEVKEKIWPLVNSSERIEQLINSAKQYKNSVILYTIFNVELESMLSTLCKKYNIRYMSAIGHIINFISDISGQSPIDAGIPGIQRKVAYEKTIESISFSIRHDDGKLLSRCNEADIVLLGVSRTSKSPTSAYLAQKGYKVANIPLVPGIQIDLKKITTPLVVGLTISPNILMHIRSSRGQSNKRFEYDSYISLQNIKSELIEAAKLFAENNIPTVDVSLKAIEEIAAEILRLYFNKRKTVNTN